MFSSPCTSDSTVMASPVVLPSARALPFIASVGDLTYLWGGEGDTEPEAVFIYRHDTETWTRRLTSGPHPPAGLSRGGCAMSGNSLYLYGGYVNDCNCGDLYQLNTQTWQWRQLSDGSAGGPGKKCGCRIISCLDQLLVVGGCYDKMPSSRQAGAKYEKRGVLGTYTNEVHGYSLTSGLWSSPRTKGSRPPPCRNFSLTMTDEDRAVMFGGITPSGMTSKAWALHLPTMTWSQHKEGDPWPGSRGDHIATCLGYGGQHQRLLISGGYDDHHTYGDMWLLDPQSGKMEQLDVPEIDKKLIKRYRHGTAAVTVNSDCVDVILFGGQEELGGSRIANPVVLRFEFQMVSTKGGKWSPTDIADSTQLGSPARLVTKRRMIQSSSSQGKMDDTMRKLEQQLQESRAREEQLQGRAGELQTQVDHSNRRAEELETQVNCANRRAGELQTQVDCANKRIEELQTQVEDANRRAEASNRRAGELQTQLQGTEDIVQHMERSLAESTQELRQCENLLQANSTHWVVRREEMELTGPQLGVGGWATVTVAKFRGTQVAVKRIHNEIISRHNLQLFQREMNMAARLRHPNLIQFIGATMEGEMMIVMELMATSLRSQLQRETYFQPLAVKAISLDVARGLNYLHLIQPDPIVHRDISSANVLLEVIQLNQWRAKLTDYGSVNLLRQLRTENPGSPLYAAPEASNPRLQSPKMDVYSFGALLLEMLTGQLPVQDDRPGMFRKIHHELLLRLIRRCFSDNPEDRPRASDIISELND